MNNSRNPYQPPGKPKSFHRNNFNNHQMGRFPSPQSQPPSLSTNSYASRPFLLGNPPPYQFPNQQSSTPFQINVTLNPGQIFPGPQYTNNYQNHSPCYQSPQSQSFSSQSQHHNPHHSYSPPPSYTEESPRAGSRTHFKNPQHDFYFHGNETFGKASFYDEMRNYGARYDDDDDKCSVQSMPTGRNEYRKSGTNRGSRGRGGSKIRKDGKNSGVSFAKQLPNDNDDDKCSVQSMQTGRNDGKRDGSNNRGNRGRGGSKFGKENKKGGTSDAKSLSNNDDDSCSVQSMPSGRNEYKRGGGINRGGRGREGRGHVGNKFVQQGKKGVESSAQFKIDGDDDDSCSVQSMPSERNEYKRGGGINRGGRGCGGNKFVQQGKKGVESSAQLKIDDDGDDDDKCSVQSMPTGRKEYKRGGDKNRRGRGCGGSNIMKENRRESSSSSKSLQNDNDDTCSVQSMSTEKNDDKNASMNKGAELRSSSGKAQEKWAKKKRRRKRKVNSAAKIDAHEKQESVSGSDSDESTICLENLKVSMKIKSLFKDSMELKNTIMEALNFPITGQFDVEFIREALLYVEKLSTCDFYIVTSNTSVARRCVKSMVEMLRKKLKTFVSFSMFIERKRRRMEKQSISKRTDSEATTSKIDVNHPSNPTGDVKESEENSKPAAKSKHKKKNKEPEICKEKEVTECVPVLFNFGIEKHFIEKKFIEFMNTLIKNISEIDEFELKKNSILLSNTTSHCSLVLKSRADAKRLKKQLHQFGKQIDTEISYSIVKVEEDTKDDEQKQNKLKLEIEETLKKMEGKKDFFLSEHEKKTSILKQKIESLKTSFEVNEAEVSALEDKFVEAYKQKMEFICMCRSIYRMIENLKSDLTKKRSDLLKLQSKFGVECQRLTKSLPIYARREDIVSHIASNQVSIVLGETGSGKSTQLVQYVYESNLDDERLIVCTQPRKVAAVQLAERVAQEMAVGIGSVVGYKAGNRRKMSDKTRIVFMTDHALLNECLTNKDFTEYCCIIVDEAHERSIYTDILLGMIKQCLPNRPELKVIITSATINPKVFIEYFQCPDEIKVSGRTYPVEIFYSDSGDDFENYETKAVSKAAEIHTGEPEGDILVFLTSPVEIQRCCEEFNRLFKDRNDFQCLPLHGQLPPEEQKKVFKNLDKGVRKIVFATNCAETSITIDGIKYVIDTGVSKEMRYDAKKNLNLLGVHVISKSSADQRKGRAGRTASGKCYRLFSEDGYDSMPIINEPEILRVHLGQAILKLAELGVNICDYEFVDAPSDFALEAAMNTLQFLGAIEGGQITEMGKWISKLPFDPKLGYFVYKASLQNLLYDAIVLAAVVSNGSGLFYRGFTETEAQVTARTKTEFGLESGDIFTWYSIYKLWLSLANNEKSQWCRSKCINYKNLNFIQQCVRETIDMFKNEMKTKVEITFSEVDESLFLGKTLFFAYGQSLCHFMGHSRAGYYSLMYDRQVHLHPSCTLAAQNIQPEWLVFTEAAKTSREFIKGILVVQEQWIHEAIASNHLEADITKAKEKTLQTVYQMELGHCVFRDVAGVRYSNLQGLEILCEENGMEHTIIEADRNMGLLSIHSSSAAVSDQVVNHLEEMKKKSLKKLSAEQSECRIFDVNSNNSPNVRAVLGKGAGVLQILMPYQTNQVLLRKVGQMTEEDIRQKFIQFGEIVEIVSFKCNEPWGFVRYQSVDEAIAAVEKTNADDCMAGSLKLEKGTGNTKNKFEAKVSWIRRPVKGHGTVFIKCNAMDRPDLVGRQIFLNGNSRCIDVSKRGKEKKHFEDDDSEPDLIIFKVGEITQEEIRDQLLCLTGRKIDARITILREVKEAPNQNELEVMKEELRSKIDPYNDEDFTLWLSKPRKETVEQVAFLYFPDPVRGLRVCNRSTGCIRMDEQLVKIAPCLKTTILVPKKIKSAVKEQIDEAAVNMQKDLSVTLDWKLIKEDHAIIIKSDNPVSIVKAREFIAKELTGDVIDCNVAIVCLCLLTKAGQQYLNQTEKKTDCLIITDKRTKKIHFYGKEANISRAKIEINSYLVANGSNKEQVFKLKGFGKPAGLMKELMNVYGVELDGLVDQFKLSAVSLDWKTHTMICIGPEEDMKTLQTFIMSVEDRLYKKKEKETDFPECVVCLGSVDSPDTMYRLEACGHAYCISCLKHQSMICVQTHQFPLVCAGGECGEYFVWKDVRFILSKNWIKVEKLVTSSLNSAVSTQPDKFKFCPTPNCPVVYNVTEEVNGCEFNCSACFASICSSCHNPFHAGVNCHMAKSVNQAEKDLEMWCGGNRKTCPKCKIPIEKIEGCNKMRCESCKIVFCWVCKEMFSDSQKCYAHLMKTHKEIY